MQQQYLKQIEESQNKVKQLDRTLVDTQQWLERELIEKKRLEEEILKYQSKDSSKNKNKNKN